MTDEAPYNPLDKINLGKSVAEALLDRPHHPLSALPSFNGAGIYVIYYTGDFGPYAPIGKENAEELRWPIYIGKAVPSGARRGIATAGNRPYVHGRLSEHRESIAAAEAQAMADGVENLRVSDFKVRYLIVDDIWIPLGESLLISTFKPVWNGMLDGFGNHDPGSGRYNGLRPLWDVIHPGRGWAMKCRARPETISDIEIRIADYLDRNAPPRSAHMKFTP